MNPKVNYLVVGLFVIVITTATLIFALWLAFGYGQRSQDTYLIYMQESVAGLSQDAAVKFNGVNVGVIKNISLDSKDPSIVIITLGVNQGTPVTADTRATLMSQGLTGLSYINLSGGNQYSAPLKAKPGEDYPVIPTNPSLFVRLDTSINKLTNSLSSINHSISYLLRDENQRYVTSILKNTADFSQSLADHRSTVGEGLVQLQQSLNSLNTQTLPTVNNSLQMTQSMLPDMQAFVRQISEDPSVLLRGEGQPTLGPGEKK
ncbi:MAG: transport system periplasmic substrate binding protein [Gammaproteobacteria bacterium]|jgi:phospholipid/cholesterol/gamma-HCH transport system substrate-binding protein|nr:transport system periplasmic substrate binding protein [Gammaproteobacteria bacterium]